VPLLLVVFQIRKNLRVKASSAYTITSRRQNSCCRFKLIIPPPLHRVPAYITYKDSTSLFVFKIYYKNKRSRRSN